MYDLVKRSDNIIKTLLSLICAGDYLYAEDVTIDDSTRAIYYRLLIPIYTREYNSRRSAQQRGIENAKAHNVCKGRKKTNIDLFLFERVLSDYTSKKATAEEAARQLGISKATFFRRLKENKN